MRILDRYVIRQAVLPYGMALLVFTFIFIIPSLIEYAEEFIVRGVGPLVVARLMATLVPQALALTIPIALLLALLVAFGRLSADREFVAMQACGVSLARLLRPVAVLAILAWAATSYVMLVLMPAGNTAFREITFNIIASSAEGDVKPRIFFDKFSDLVLYVREVPPDGGGWDGVFIADSRPGQPRAVYIAKHGRVVIDRAQQTVQLTLDDVARHTVDPDGTYHVGASDHLVLALDPRNVFPRGGIAKGDNELTVAELRARIAELERAGQPAHNQVIAVQWKFAIPVACFVFALMGLALGATNRRDGTLGSFAIGLVVVFCYYIPLYLGPAMAKGGIIPPWVAAWLPNAIIGAAAAMLLARRTRSADQPIEIPGVARLRARLARRGTGLSLRRRLPFLRLLDQYVIATYFRLFVLSGLGMAAIFYISTFIDRSDKVFKGTATWGMLAEYFWYASPQFGYYILPLAVLLGTLITMSVLTRNSEIVVMKACGISLYRIAMPMFACALGVAGVLALLDQASLGRANHRADELILEMRGLSPARLDFVGGRWVTGQDGTIYHYEAFNPRQREMQGVDVFSFAPGTERLTRRTYAAGAIAAATGVTPDAWDLSQGWTRTFDARGLPAVFDGFATRRLAMESPAYFGTDELDPKYMNYTQLRSYVDRLRARGFNVLAQEVRLARRLAFPFVTLIMTLIAVPFAVTTGRSGAMAGLAVGIALAITYWMTISVFAAMGTGGLLAPVLAAWAPNILFGTGAAYLLLTVRT